MNKTNALSTFIEIVERCDKRNTKIAQLVSTKDADVFVVVFTDGTQANINTTVLNQLHEQLPAELAVSPHTV